MKLIHCADLHLDSKMESNLSREKAFERREELLSTFAAMVDYAREHSVRAILIAGDLFDTSQNTQKRMKNRVLDQIKYAKEIDFLYLRGNHDQVDFFDSLPDKPINLKTFTDTWSSYTYDNVTITGCELHKGSPSSIYSHLSLDKEQVNIVMLHGQESRYENKGDAEVINLRALQNRYIDYLALGHIHTYKYERLDGRGFYCYSGCLEGRGFDECGPKGFVLLTIEEGKITHTFLPIARRTLHEVQLSLSGYMEENTIVHKLEEAIRTISPRDLVKVVLTGEVDAQTDIDVKYLLGRFSDRFYFLKLYDHTTLMLRKEDYQNDISLKGEFIRMVEEQDLEENEKKAIIMLGLKALAGRDIDL